MNYESNYGLEEAGMAQLDNSIGELLRHLQDIGEADNTIVIFTSRSSTSARIRSSERRGPAARRPTTWAAAT